MLRLIGEAIEGEPVEFDIDEIENVFPSDGVLYVGDGFSQTAVKIESIKVCPTTGAVDGARVCPECDGAVEFCAMGHYVPANSPRH